MQEKRSVQENPSVQEKPRAQAKQRAQVTGHAQVTGRESGIGLVAAIFLITVVALIAVAITRSVRAGADAYALETVAQRALFAAESGAQLALNAVYAPAGSGSCVSVTFNLEAVGLNGCAADTRCTSESVDGDTYFTLVATGQCSVGGVTAERIVRVRAK